MIKCCIHTASVITKNTVRRLYFWCFLLGSLILMVEQYQFYLSQAQYRYLVQATAPGMELLFLGMLVMGVQIVQQNRAPRIHEHISTLPNGILCYAAGSALSIAGISAMIALGIASVNAVILRLHGGCAWYWILQVSAEFILRYFFGCLLCGWIGLLIGEWIPGRLSYIAVFVCWFCIGAQSVTLAYYLRMIGIDQEEKTFFAFLRDIWNLMYLDMPKELPDATVGASFEVYRWIVRITQTLGLGIFGCCSVLFRHPMTKIKAKFALAVVPFAVLIPLTGAVYSLCGNFYGSFATDRRALHYFSEGYNQPASRGEAYLCEEEWPREDSVTVLSNDIELKAGLMGIQVTCSMELSADREVEGQLFTLDRCYMVKDLTVNGAAARWERSLDGLWVEFGKTIQSGEKISMTVSYEGAGNPQFPASQYTLQLRDVHAWVPWPGLGDEDPNQVTMLLDERLTDRDTVVYTLKYQGPKGIYTNLTKTAENEYAGTVRGGVVILSDMVPVKLSQDRVCYIPVSLVRSDNVQVLEGYLQCLQNEFQNTAAGALRWLIPEEYLAELGSQQWEEKDAYVIMQRQSAMDDRLYRMRENIIEVNLRAMEEYEYARWIVQEGQENAIQTQGMIDCDRVILSIMEKGCSVEFRAFALYFPHYPGEELAEADMAEWKDDMDTMMGAIFHGLDTEQRQAVIDAMIDKPLQTRQFFSEWYRCELDGNMKYTDHQTFYDDFMKMLKPEGESYES